MKDSNGQEKPTGKGRNGDRPENAPSELMAGYTPKQREVFQRGLRIWARVAVRSYIRKREAGSLPEAGEDGSGEKDE